MAKKNVRTSKPEHNPQYAGIFSGFKSEEQWLAWKSESGKDDKFVVVPYGSDGKKADIGDASHFMKFGKARALQRKKEFDGVGIVTTEDSGLAVVEIDVEDGEISDLAREIIDSLGSYAEFSPSGDCVRVFVEGELPEPEDYIRTNLELGLKIYGDGKYFPVTGNIVEDGNTLVEENTEAVREICEKYMKKSDIDPSELSLSDEEIIKLCKKGKGAEKFKKLWSANYGIRYSTPSEASQTLFRLLADFTIDPEQIERIFQKSGLAEDFDEKKDSELRNRVITQAVQKAESKRRFREENPEVPEAFFCDYAGGKWRLNENEYLEWIQDQGIHMMEIKGGDPVIVSVSEDNLIEEIDSKKLKAFVLKKLTGTGHDHEKDVINKTSSKPFKDWFLLGTIPREINFLKDTRDTAYFFFLNGFAEVTAKGYKFHSYAKLRKMGLYVWKKRMSSWNFVKVKGRGEFGQFVRNISSYPTPSANSKNKKANDYDYYFHKSKYNAIRSALGEKLHSYNSPSKAVATIFVDYDMDESSNGRTGKSLLGESLEHFKKTVVKSGRTFKSKDTFAFQDVNEDTQLVVLDDIQKDFKFEDIFTQITGNFEFEKKMKSKVTIPFKESPKIIITSNYPILGGGRSHERRQHIVEISDFYGEFDIGDIHKTELFSEEWSEDEWNRFSLFMMKCLRFYLDSGLKSSVSGTYEESKLRGECSEEFVDWADGFFQMGKRCKKDVAYYNFLKTTGFNETNFKKKRFKTTLKDYVKGRGLELNPHKAGLRDKRDRTKKNGKNVEYLTLVKIKPQKKSGGRS